MRRYFTDEEKIEICDFYSNNNEDAMLQKYGVGRNTVNPWRKKFGYPNKLAGSWPKCRSKNTVAGGYIVNGKYVKELPEVTPEDTIMQINGVVVPMRVKFILEPAA